MNRRALLTTGGVTLAGALAGCTALLDVMGSSSKTLHIDNSDSTPHTVTVTVLAQETSKTLTETTVELGSATEASGETTITVSEGQPGQILIRVDDGEEHQYYWDGNDCGKSTVIINGKQKVGFQEDACD